MSQLRIPSIYLNFFSSESLPFISSLRKRSTRNPGNLPPRVRNWKHCLATVANLSGWDVRNRNESESIKIIVDYILYKLNVTTPTISKNLVGIDSRLEGKDKIEAIFLDLPGITEAQWNMEAFSKISKLRLLKINNVQLSEGSQDLSNMLRFLEWHFYPSKSLPACLQVDELVELHMPNSSIEQLWYGHKRAINLEIIDLSNSISLVRTLDFTSIPNLKRLILEGCISLYEVHPSLGHHKKVQYVNLVNCRNIRALPCNLEMESLQVFSLDGCSKLEKFPDIVGNMSKLMEFDLSGTSIKQLLASISLLKNLKVLSLDECKRIGVLPSLYGLCSLEVLSLRDCHLKEGALPEHIGCLSSLMSLDLSHHDFVSLPKSIINLSRLEMLILEDCKMFESLPMVPSKVQTVNLNSCILLKQIPDPIKLSSSKRLEFLCLNYWELYKHNDQDNMGFTMLEKYLQGFWNPRPGFGIVILGNEIPGWFNHQKKGSSINVEVHSWSMGFIACVAFSASGESPSLFCNFKANGREHYPSPMGISCNSIQVLLDHLWLFYLSFDYLRELKEWQHESFSNIELSFDSSEQVKVKNCGLFLFYCLHTPPSSHIQWMQDDIPFIRGADTSNGFTHLSIAPALRGTIPNDKELKKVTTTRSILLEAIEESGLSVIIFARDCASLTWCFDELVKMVGFMYEIRPDTVFPVSYDIKHSMIDDQTKRYTIVFNKDEENFTDEVKIKRWMNILTGVENDEKSEPKSLKSTEGPLQIPQLSWPILRQWSVLIPLLSQQVQPLERFRQLQNLESCARNHTAINFFGKDTRDNFTGHLYSNLVQRGIDVYMDDRELERGKTIEPALWKAIEESRFSVVVDELVGLHMPNNGVQQLWYGYKNLGEVESLEEVDLSGTLIKELPASIFRLQNLKVLSLDGCERIVVLSLSGLCSLEVLSLCARHLREGAFLDDIGLLSMNSCKNLTSIPEGISFLKLLKKLDMFAYYELQYIPKKLGEVKSLEELEMLVLEDCKMLKSLPWVPSKVQIVNLNSCICLKKTPDPINLSSSKRLEFTCKWKRELSFIDGMPDGHWMQDDIPVIRGSDTNNAFTHLSTTPSLRGTIPNDKELEKDEVKVKKWMNILTRVENSEKSRSESLKR
ncbi:hypothetical protein SADUNF_Sadunf17G0100700 [Salix dunnii]|uniref:TIR domain-containing protein n=1 Tax=Salix dunnii TaxID=1413687 RepID=A0A835MF72_9ROSI|nr:hypothetical protein SADUNF_Sadunf17G0100700 [Salix dunnii]